MQVQIQYRLNQLINAKHRKPAKTISVCVHTFRNMSMLSPEHRGKPAVRGNDNGNFVFKL